MAKNKSVLLGYESFAKAGLCVLNYGDNRK